MPDLIDPGAIGVNIYNAFRQGQQQAQQQRGQNALAQYAANPTPENLNALTPYNPAFVIQARKQQADATAAAHKEQRADLPVMLKLLNHATDETSFQQARHIAASYGIDVSEVPEHYDPAWVENTKQLAAAMQTKGGQEALSTFGKIATDEGLQPGTPEFAQRVTQLWHSDQNKTVPYQPGGGIANYDPVTGQVTPLVIPNPGGMPAGAPAGHVQTKTIGGKTYYQDSHGDWYEGEPAGNGGGNFPNIERYYSR